MNIWLKAIVSVSVLGSAFFAGKSDWAVGKLQNAIRVESSCDATPTSFAITERSMRNIRNAFEVTAEFSIEIPSHKVVVGDRDTSTEIAFGIVNSIDVYEDEIYVDIAPGLTRLTSFRFRNVPNDCIFSLEKMSLRSPQMMRIMR